VEDDPLLRMLAVEVVEEAGFVALEAGNLDEAVALPSGLRSPTTAPASLTACSRNRKPGLVPA
jgi:hypothetical protein